MVKQIVSCQPVKRRQHVGQSHGVGEVPFIHIDADDVTVRVNVVHVPQPAAQFRQVDNRVVEQAADNVAGGEGVGMAVFGHLAFEHAP